MDQSPTTVHEPFSAIEDNEFSIPIGDFWRVEFDVHILKRLHKDLVDEYISLGSEAFRVRIQSAYYSPVTFVVTSDLEDDPSDAVRLVREFLSRELGHHPIVPFQYLGPSPYHMDCFLKPAPPNTLPVAWACALEPSTAYDRATFTYNPDFYETEDDLFEDIFHATAEEICLQYYATQLDLRRSRQWDRVAGAINRVRELGSAQGWRGRLRWFLRSGLQLEQAFIDLADFEMADIGDRQDLDRGYRSIYDGRGRTFFQAHADEALKGRYVFPTKQAADLLALVERRQSRRSDWIALVIASLAGGAVGGLITDLFARSGH
jgi:hypothetical protein